LVEFFIFICLGLSIIISCFLKRPNEKSLWDYSKISLQYLSKKWPWPKVFSKFKKTYSPQRQEERKKVVGES